MTNTLAKLEELTTKFKSNQEFAKNKISPALQRDLEALKTGGGLSFEDLKAHRSDVGEYIGEAVIGEGSTRSELRGLYSALSADMEATAASVSPKALAEFKRANAAAERNFYLQEKVFAPIIGKSADKSFESIAKTFQGMVRDGKKSADIAAVAKLRAGMTKDEWGEAQSGFIRMMGQPVSSEGREFNASTFVNLYKDMTPMARNVIFGPKGDLREAIDEFSTVVERLASRDSLRNTSNTAANLNLSGAVVTGTSAIFNPMSAVYLGSGLLLSNASAKLWTNPKFVKWATGYTKMVAGAAKAGGTPSNAKHAELLRRLAAKEPSITTPANALADLLMGAANDNAGMVAGAAAEDGSTGQEVKSDNR